LPELSFDVNILIIVIPPVWFILNILLIIVACVFGLLLLSQVVSRILVKIFHYSPPVSHITGPILDSRVRALIQPPSQIIKRSGIKKTMKVLDIGCGGGMFTVYASKAVGNDGCVYALDIQKEMLEQLKEKLVSVKDGDYGTVIPLEGSADKLPVKSASLDLVYIISTLQEITERGRALLEIKRVLKRGGILSISETAVDIDYFLKSTVVKFCREAGFTLDSFNGNFFSYTLRFIKN